MLWNGWTDKECLMQFAGYLWLPLLQTQMYGELCLAAKNEEKRQADFRKRE